MNKTKFKIVMLHILSFFCSTLPVIIYFAINHHKYLSTVPEKIKLGVGAVALCVIIVLKLVGKLKINSRIIIFGIVFAFSYLLEAILDDLLVFSFLALVGEALDLIIGIFIKKEKRKLELRESAEAHAEAIEKIVEKSKVSGR